MIDLINNNSMHGWTPHLRSIRFAISVQLFSIVHEQYIELLWACMLRHREYENFILGGQFSTKWKRVVRGGRSYFVMVWQRKDVPRNIFHAIVAILPLTPTNTNTPFAAVLSYIDLVITVMRYNWEQCLLYWASSLNYGLFVLATYFY